VWLIRECKSLECCGSIDKSRNVARGLSKLIHPSRDQEVLTAAPDVIRHLYVLDDAGLHQLAEHKAHTVTTVYGQENSASKLAKPSSDLFQRKVPMGHPSRRGLIAREKAFELLSICARDTDIGRLCCVERAHSFNGADLFRRAVLQLFVTR
jgi:hypothetical protein